MLNDRARAVLLGGAIGDAFGTTLEFASVPALPWSPLLTGPHADMVGRGPFGLLPGQVTDDTHMARCLADTLADPGAGGAYDPLGAATRYAAWERLSFDAGGQTRAALAAFRSGVSPALSGLSIWRPTRSAAGNGALMRTWAIPAYLPPEQVSRASIDDAAITHADPRCVLACLSYNAAISAGLAGDPEHGMLHAAREALAQGSQTLTALWPDERAAIGTALTALLVDLSAGEHDDPNFGGMAIAGATQGFVRVAFRLAFWELLHAPTWRDAVVDAVNRGGDADTNGAIVGALLAAKHGLEALPPRWLSQVLEVDPPAAFGRSGLYHPAGFPGL